MHEAHLLGIGSITKTFVAVVIHQLVREGRLGYGTTPREVLGKRVDGIPNADRATISQLLTHTSGIPSWEFDPDWIRQARGAEIRSGRVWRNDETLVFIRDGRHAATHAPGAGYGYSNSNHTLLGLMIEQVTGETALQQIDRRIRQPLGLHDIRLEGFETLPVERIPHRYHFGSAEFVANAGLSPGFVRVSPELIDVSASSLAPEWVAGGMVSTAHDLCEYMGALRDGRLLPAQSMQRVLGFQRAEPDVEVGEGLFRSATPHGVLIGHGGGVLGFSAWAGWLADADATIALLTNVGTMHAGPQRLSAWRLLNDTTLLKTVRRLTQSLSPDRRHRK